MSVFTHIFSLPRKENSPRLFLLELGEVNPFLLFVQHEHVSMVTGASRGEGLEVVANDLSCFQLPSLYVAAGVFASDVRRGRGLLKYYHVEDCDS